MGSRDRAAIGQTIGSVVLELQPESVGKLRAQLEQMRLRQEALTEAFGSIRHAMPLLHFMSVTIFADDQYDPILVVEVNFDGPQGPFWAQFEAAFGEDLRSMLRCGRVPHDGRRDLFLAVTRAGSSLPIAPLLEALVVLPSAGHQGNRGLSRARIEVEGELFGAVQKLLDRGTLPKDATQVAIHRIVRETLLPRFSWLADAVPLRIGAVESWMDWLRLIGFAALVLFAMLLPGIVLSLVIPSIAALALLLWAGAALLSRLGLGLSSQPTAAAIFQFFKAGSVVLVATAAMAALCAVPASIHDWRFDQFGRVFGVVAVHFGLGVIGLFPTVTGILVWLRSLEGRDAPQDAPPRDEVALSAMARREDKIAQNHMGSVVHLKPGLLRAVLVRVALQVMGLVLRVRARNGFLGSMRTIHFAHWAVVSNGARLMFLSNFDGSWESYLDDFVEKAHGGLTLAWTSCVGFPTTRFMTLDGATQGRKFKAWARHSMAESLFWYSAYVSFTVNQIERQARVANGLCRVSLGEVEAAAWALDL